MRFWTFDEVASLSNPIHHQEYKIVKKIWDNHKDIYLTYLPTMPDKDKCLPSIRRVFGNDVHAAKVMRPLGDFKDLEKEVMSGRMTHEDIYNQWIATLTELHSITYKGKPMTASFLQTIFCSFQSAQNFWWQEQRYDADHLLKGLSIMLYHSSWRLVEEFYTIELFRKIHGSSFLEVKAAPADLESEDVDLIINNKCSNSASVLVSIKNGPALGVACIKDFRGRGKILPRFYCGLDRKGNGLRYKDVNGNDITKERIDEFLLLGGFDGRQLP